MKTTFEIQNLKCNGCASTILKKMSALKNVGEVEVNTENNKVSFNHTDEETLIIVKTLLHNIGYPVDGQKNALKTKAKSFVSCAIGRINS